jgi:hypothetical protein
LVGAWRWEFVVVSLMLGGRVFNMGCGLWLDVKEVWLELRDSRRVEQEHVRLKGCCVRAIYVETAQVHGC